MSNRYQCIGLRTCILAAGLLLVFTAGATGQVFQNQSMGLRQNILSIECKYIMADDARRVLQEQLGDPAAFLERLMDEHARRFTRDQLGAPAKLVPPIGATPKLAPPNYVIAVDAQTNTVCLIGTVETLERAKAILASIDRPQSPMIICYSPVFRTYSLRCDSASAIEKILQDTYSTNRSVRIQAIGKSLLVYAHPQSHAEIDRLVKALDDRLFIRPTK